MYVCMYFYSYRYLHICMHTHIHVGAYSLRYPSTGGIYSAAAAGGRPRVLLPVRLPSVARPCVAGATWTLVIASAPWAARYSHTTVIDGAGAIYVIGGSGGTTNYKDVWKSTDGGADRT